MKKALVLGIGSRIMTDDSIGIKLIEDLANGASNPDIAYVAGETDVEYCLDEILDFKNVIVIDAYMSGKQPGSITTVPLCEIADTGFHDIDYCSAHSLHLLDRLKSKRYSCDVSFIGIEPYDISYGFTLSESMQKQYYNILIDVRSRIEEYMSKI
jgi:hydrogenase maturation protease